MFDEQMPAERRACTTNSAGRGVSNDAVLRNIHVLKTRDKISDVNKDWTCKDKDLNLVLKESLRTRTSLTVTYCKLQLNLQSLSSDNNEHKVKVHNI